MLVRKDKMFISEINRFEKTDFFRILENRWAKLGSAVKEDPHTFVFQCHDREGRLLHSGDILLHISCGTSFTNIVETLKQYIFKDPKCTRAIIRVFYNIDFDI